MTYSQLDKQGSREKINNRLGQRVFGAQVEPECLSPGRSGKYFLPKYKSNTMWGKYVCVSAPSRKEINSFHQCKYLTEDKGPVLDTSRYVFLFDKQNNSKTVYMQLQPSERGYQCSGLNQVWAVTSVKIQSSVLYIVVTDLRCLQPVNNPLKKSQKLYMNTAAFWSRDQDFRALNEKLLSDQLSRELYQDSNSFCADKPDRVFNSS